MRNPILKYMHFDCWLRLGVAIALMITSLPIHFVEAQDLVLPLPGVRVSLSPAFNPPVLRGVTVDPKNPFKFDFILDKGNRQPGDMTSVVYPQAGYFQRSSPSSLPSEKGLNVKATQGKNRLPNETELKKESQKLVKYFLSAITTPEKDLWVNLSPYEKNRIIPESFGQTDMGRDLLAQDYLLKQITSSLMYPEEEIGKRFWRRIYEEAAKQGITNVPVNTFNKVWIVPDKAKVYEHGNTAFIVNSRLKVMLESDYVAEEKNFLQPGDIVSLGAKAPIESVSPSSLLSNKVLKTKANQGNPISPHQDSFTELSKNIIKEIIIPDLEKEVNEGKNFAPLRQVYQSLILAVWFKNRMKDSILGRKYMDQNKVMGIDIDDKEVKQKIYEQYLQAFKKGVYNYIKEELDAATGNMIPRKYFSGGWEGKFNPQDIDWAQTINMDEAQIADPVLVSVNLSNSEGNPKSSETDQAMISPKALVSGAINKVKEAIRSKRIKSAVKYFMQQGERRSTVFNYDDLDFSFGDSQKLEKMVESLLSDSKFNSRFGAYEAWSVTNAIKKDPVGEGQKIIAALIKRAEEVYAYTKEYTKLDYNYERSRSLARVDYREEDIVNGKIKAGSPGWKLFLLVHPNHIKEVDTYLRQKGYQFKLWGRKGIGQQFDLYIGSWGLANKLAFEIQRDLKDVLINTASPGRYDEGIGDGMLLESGLVARFAIERPGVYWQGSYGIPHTEKTNFANDFESLVSRFKFFLEKFGDYFYPIDKAQLSDVSDQAMNYPKATLNESKQVIKLEWSEGEQIREANFSYDQKGQIKYLAIKLGDNQEEGSVSSEVVLGGDKKLHFTYEDGVPKVWITDNGKKWIFSGYQLKEINQAGEESWSYITIKNFGEKYDALESDSHLSMYYFLMFLKRKGVEINRLFNFDLHHDVYKKFAGRIGAQFIPAINYTNWVLKAIEAGYVKAVSWIYPSWYQLSEEDRQDTSSHDAIDLIVDRIPESQIKEPHVVTVDFDYISSSSFPMKHVANQDEIDATVAKISSFVERNKGTLVGINFNRSAFSEIENENYSPKDDSTYILNALVSSMAEVLGEPKLTKIKGDPFSSFRLVIGKSGKSGDSAQLREADQAMNTFLELNPSDQGSSSDSWEEVIRKEKRWHAGIDFKKLLPLDTRLFVIGDTNHGLLGIQKGLIQHLQAFKEAGITDIFLELPSDIAEEQIESELQKTWIPHRANLFVALARELGMKIHFMDMPDKLLDGKNPVSPEGSLARGIYMGQHLVNFLQEHQDVKVLAVTGAMHIFQHDQIPMQILNSNIPTVFSVVISKDQMGSGILDFDKRLPIVKFIEKLKSKSDGYIDTVGMSNFKTDWISSILFFNRPKMEAQTAGELESVKGMDYLEALESIFHLADIKESDLKEPASMSFRSGVGGESQNIATNIERVIQFINNLNGISNEKKLYLATLLMQHVRTPYPQGLGEGVIKYMGFVPQGQFFEFEMETFGFNQNTDDEGEMPTKSEEVSIRTLREWYGWVDDLDELSRINNVSIKNNPKKPLSLLDFVRFIVLAKKHPERVSVAFSAQKEDQTVSVYDRDMTNITKGQLFYPVVQLSVDDFELSTLENRLYETGSYLHNLELTVFGMGGGLESTIKYFFADQIKNEEWRILVESMHEANEIGKLLDYQQGLILDRPTIAKQFIVTKILEARKELRTINRSQALEILQEIKQRIDVLKNAKASLDQYLAKNRDKITFNPKVNDTGINKFWSDVDYYENKKGKIDDLDGIYKEIEKLIDDEFLSGLNNRAMNSQETPSKIKLSGKTMGLEDKGDRAQNTESRDSLNRIAEKALNNFIDQLSDLGLPPHLIREVLNQLTRDEIIEIWELSQNLSEQKRKDSLRNLLAVWVDFFKLEGNEEEVYLKAFHNSIVNKDSEGQERAEQMLDRVRERVVSQNILLTHHYQLLMNIEIIVSKEVPSFGVIFHRGEFISRPTIMLNALIVSKMNDVQLAYLIGHELGHVLLGDVHYTVENLRDHEKQFSFDMLALIEDRADIIGGFAAYEFSKEPSKDIIHLFEMFEKFRPEIRRLANAYPGFYPDKGFDPHRPPEERKRFFESTLNHVSFLPSSFKWPVEIIGPKERMIRGMEEIKWERGREDLSVQKQTPGGIDLTKDRMNLEVDKDDKAQFLGPMDLKALENIEINALYIKDIEIKPLSNLPELLGIGS